MLWTRLNHAAIGLKTIVIVLVGGSMSSVFPGPQTHRRMGRGSVNEFMLLTTPPKFSIFHPNDAET